MNQTTHLLTMKLDCEEAVTRVVQRLSNDGLEVVRSFNLQTARSAHTNCTCPYHGTALCDCQMVVLLVYDRQGQPITLVAHGQDGRTHFSLVEVPQEDQQEHVKTAILDALVVEGFATVRRSQYAHAP